MILNVKDFQAIGDGKAKDTKAINNAIDQLSKAGGGTLYFPNGTYLCGTIFLKSNVTLDLDVNAIILGSGERADYADKEKVYGSVFINEDNMEGCLIYGENLNNIGITGRGVIDGNGIACTVGKENEHLYPRGKNHYGKEKNFESYLNYRPFSVRLVGCNNIHIKDVRFVNPASWNVGCILCNDIFIDSVDIKSHGFYNGDGLDFNACERVTIANCTFNCTDDCIALQNSFSDKFCKNITISNCIFTSLFAGIRIGIASVGNFENIIVNGCIFDECLCSGLKVQQNEGGSIKNLLFSNLIMKNTVRPFYFTFNKMYVSKSTQNFNVYKLGELSDIKISNIIAHYDRDCNITGFIFDSSNECKIKNIDIENVTVNLFGRNKMVERDITSIPDLAHNRPEAHIFEGYEMWRALFIRNAENFYIRNFIVKYNGKEAMHSVVLDSCENIEFERFYSDNTLKGEFKTVRSKNINLNGKSM